MLLSILILVIKIKFLRTVRYAGAIALFRKDIRVVYKLLYNIVKCSSSHVGPLKRVPFIIV